MMANGSTTNSTATANIIGRTVNIMTESGSRAGFKDVALSGDMVFKWNRLFVLFLNRAARYPNGLQVTGQWDNGMLAMKQ
jgi:hypothetical protein